MKKLLSSLVIGGALLATSAFAQVANLSVTAASSFASLNLTSNAVAPTATTAFSNDGSTLLLIKGGAAVSTVTITSFATQIFQNGYGYAPLTNLVVSVPASAYMVVGPFPQARYNSPQGTVVAGFTNVTGLTVAAVSVAQ